MTKIIMAIDPDVDKSGVAIWIDGTLIVASMDFPTLVENVRNTSGEITVIVEAGWLNKTHYHLSTKDNIFSSAAKGNAVGRNHETGRKLIEYFNHFATINKKKIKVLEVRPLRKIWKGPGKKITHDELARLVPRLPKRTNQEERDAVLLLMAHIKSNRF